MGSKGADTGNGCMRIRGEFERDMEFSFASIAFYKPHEHYPFVGVTAKTVERYCNGTMLRQQ